MRHIMTVGFSVDTGEASISARMSWVVHTAQELGVLTDADVQLWMMAGHTDRDLLDAVISDESLSLMVNDQLGHSDRRHTAEALSHEVNNLLQALVLSETGNYNVIW